MTEAIERAGESVLPLPPARPDFSPVEEMFSKFKEAFRRPGDDRGIPSYSNN
ncbi:MAG: hypothetical protein P4L84_19925 [Isosphaeraceae bacterium]|nr:hypothetical protein [Isosphaeraceae bacterium]